MCRLFVLLLLSVWAGLSNASDATNAKPVNRYAKAYISRWETEYTTDWDGNVHTHCIDSSMVALTFDDGVNEGTNRVLKFLKIHGIRATFFVLGSQIDRRMLQRMVADGHVIGSHSWDHPSFVHTSEDNMRWQLESTDDAIYEAVKRRPKFFRPPYGEVDWRVSKVVRNEGYELVNWNIDSQDWHGDAQAASSNIRNGILGWDKALRLAAGFEQQKGRRRGGYIILQHDYYFQKFVGKDTIRAVKEKGLRFVTLDECLGMDPYRNQRQVNRQTRNKVSVAPPPPSSTKTSSQSQSSATKKPTSSTTSQMTRTITKTTTVTRSSASASSSSTMATTLSPIPLSTITKAEIVST